ncbi:MAG TPA: hypothetical protein VEY67_00750, partial [Candidatus Dormibacteraeota bacterium]|nr:hypothetical protein [Candidatus Dormibacteraeota bacterium]
GLLVDLPRLGTTRVALRGRHQAANVGVADAMLDALDRAGIAHVPDDARRQGYATARWPGRLELLEVGRDGGSVEVLLDGAHNEAGAVALAAALDDLRPHLAGGVAKPPAPLTLLMAVMADKDVAAMIRGLASADALRGARVICTTAASPRALPAEALADRWRQLGPAVGSVEAIPRIEDGLEAALARAAGPVVVAGSLYLVGDVRARLAPDPDLADPAVGAA